VDGSTSITVKPSDSPRVPDALTVIRDSQESSRTSLV
jgi:hypothetical protein